MNIRKFLFGDLPLYRVVEEVVGGIAFVALIAGLIFLYITF